MSDREIIYQQKNEVIKLLLKGKEKPKPIVKNDNYYISLLRRFFLW